MNRRVIKRIVLLFALLCFSCMVASAQVTISSQQIKNWQGGTSVELRIYALDDFVDASGQPVQKGSPYDITQAKWFTKVTCTVASTTLTCPAVTVPPTENSIDKPSAKLGAFLFNPTTSRLIGPYSVFSSFSVPASPSSTTWADLRTHNIGTLPAVAPHNVTVTGNQTVGGNLTVTGSITGGSFSGITASAVPTTLPNRTLTNATTTNLANTGTMTIQNMNASGTVTANAFVGNCSACTGITGATGGVANTGSTTIGADTDANGSGVIDLQIGGATKFRINNDGSLSIVGRGGLLYQPFSIERQIAEYSSITGAIAEIGSTRTRLVIDRNTTVATGTTFPSTLTLVFTGAGKFTLPDNAYAEAFGLIQADNDAQIFSLGSGARFNFGGNRAQSRFSARWWGVDCSLSNTSNSGPALNAALDAVGGYSVVELPDHCSMQTTVPIKLNGKSGVTLASNTRGSNYAAAEGALASITYTGAATRAAVEMMNCASCGIHGIAVNTGNADTGIDIDFDNDVLMTGVSGTSGSANLTYVTRGDLITLVGPAGRAVDLGRQVVVRNSSNTVVLTTTLVGANNATNTITTADPLPSNLSGGSALIISPYPAGVSTSATLDHVTVKNNGPANAEWAGVRISATSNQNNERVRLDDMVIYSNAPLAAPTNFNYGTGIAIGDASIGGGSNTLNISITNSYIAAVSYGVRSYSSQYLALNNEYTWVTTVHDQTASEALVEFDRPETHRQFLVSRGGNATMISCNIPYGGWDNSYPIVYAEHSKLTMRHVTYSQQEGVNAVDADPLSESSIVIESNTWPSFTSRPTFANFSGGAVDLLSFSQRVDFKGKYGVVISNSGTVFSAMGTQENSNGSWVFCKDCVAGSTPCSGGGTGAFAFRVNGVWKCPF